MNLDESPVELTVRVVLVEVVTVMGEGSGIISTSSSCMVDVVVPSAPNSFFTLSQIHSQASSYHVFPPASILRTGLFPQ